MWDMLSACHGERSSPLDLAIRKIGDLRRDKLNVASWGILTSGAEGTLHHPSVSFRSRKARSGERSSPQFTELP
jgi:hypothetical protein